MQIPVSWVRSPVINPFNHQDFVTLYTTSPVFLNQKSLKDKLMRGSGTKDEKQPVFTFSVELRGQGVTGPGVNSRIAAV